MVNLQAKLQHHAACRPYVITIFHTNKPSTTRRGTCVTCVRFISREGDFSEQRNVHGKPFRHDIRQEDPPKRVEPPATGGGRADAAHTPPLRFATNITNAHSLAASQDRPTQRTNLPPFGHQAATTTRGRNKGEQLCYNDTNQKDLLVSTAVPHYCCSGARGAVLWTQEGTTEASPALRKYLLL